MPGESVLRGLLPGESALRGLTSLWSSTARQLGPRRVVRHGLRACLAHLAELAHGRQSRSHGRSSSVRAAALVDSPELETMQYNDHPMSSQPLYIIIGLAMTLLAADVAFGACMRRDRGLPRPVPAAAATAAKSSDAAPSEWGEFKRTRSQFLVLTMLLGFASEFLLWMLAPFYPKEAYARGVSPEVVGFLFAAHPIALLISAQFAPYLMRIVEPFVLLQRTLFLQAIFIAGFGLAGTITEGVPFVCCAAVNRFFLGLMCGLHEPTSPHLPPLY